MSCPWWLSGKESACNAGDSCSISELGRSPGEGNGNPFQYSCLENPRDRGAWWSTVHGIAKIWTQLSDHHFPPFSSPPTMSCIGPVLPSNITCIISHIPQPRFLQTWKLTLVSQGRWTAEWEIKCCLLDSLLLAEAYRSPLLSLQGLPHAASHSQPLCDGSWAGVFPSVCYMSTLAFTFNDFVNVPWPVRGRDKTGTCSLSSDINWNIDNSRPFNVL